ncbi:hypothetical protein BJX64DRAFT_264010 [Aspergillus heterothallicus]
MEEKQSRPAHKVCISKDTAVIELRCRYCYFELVCGSAAISLGYIAYEPSSV